MYERWLSTTVHDEMYQTLVRDQAWETNTQQFGESFVSLYGSKSSLL